MQQLAFPLETVLRWTSEITSKGVRADREYLIDTIREALDALVEEQPVDSLRKWCIPSSGCYVVMPKEMGHPLKYKVGEKIGRVRNHFYDFRGFDRVDCQGFREDIKYEGDCPTYFDLPSNGGRLAARSMQNFAPNAKPRLLVMGKGVDGQEVYHTNEQGVVDLGEIVEISQPYESPNYTKAIFSKIDRVRVINSMLNVQLYYCNVKEYGQSPFEMGLLSFYDPGDEYPMFRRYSVPLASSDCCYNVEILAPICVPPLVMDNELIRGFSSNAIKNMIRAIYYGNQNDIQNATFHSGLAKTNVRKANDRKSNDTDSLDFFKPTSASSFRGI